MERFFLVASLFGRFAFSLTFYVIPAKAGIHNYNTSLHTSASPLNAVNKVAIIFRIYSVKCTPCALHKYFLAKKILKCNAYKKDATLTKFVVHKPIHFFTFLLLLTKTEKNMSVKFRVIQKKNPQDLLATPKSYAIAISDGTVDIDRLSELVGDGSTVRQNDVYAVIIGLVNVIQGELKEGRSVNLGKLGTFAISVSSNPSDTAEEVTASNIKSAKVNYRPGKEIKDMLKTISYTKIST